MDNILGNHRANAPHSMTGKQQHFSLTNHGVWNIRELAVGASHQDKNLVVQISNFKLIDGDLKIRAKCLLSDGVASVNCVVSEGVFNKMGPVKDKDVVLVKSFKLAD